MATNFNPGFVLGIGEVAILSSTAGAFCEFGDYASGWYLCIAYVGVDGLGLARFKIIRTDTPKS